MIQLKRIETELLSLDPILQQINKINQDYINKVDVINNMIDLLQECHEYILGDLDGAPDMSPRDKQGNHLVGRIEETLRYIQK